MKLSEDLSYRGLIKDKTFKDNGWLDEPRSFYLGIDASADSLTIGNLAILMLARRLSDAGWKAMLLMGGGTSLVGDPGGKDEERQLMTRETVQKNIEGVRAQVTKIFQGEDYQMVDNYDWLSELKYLDVLREIGKHFSMTELMQRDFVQTRLGEGGSGISYAEFSYSIVQGYDYWYLFKNFQVVLQIGGSDQWGNLMSGVPLTRKKESAEAHALSMPLIINKSTGKKFGKSEEGAVWLDPAKTSPTKFYQFWINVDDAGAEDYLKVYTKLSREEIEQVISKHNQNRSERSAQTRLAQEVTKIVHGEEETRLAESVTKYLTGQKPVGEIDSLELDELRKELPSIKARVGDDIAIKLVEAGLISSNREGREVRAAGGIYINNTGVTSETFANDHFQNGRLLLRRGKAFKDSALVELEQQ